MYQTISKVACLFITIVVLFLSCDQSSNNITPTSTVKYTNKIENIMFNYCTACHGGAAPSASVDLTTYQNVRQQALNGSLVQRVNDVNNPMPASGLIPASLRKEIDDWVQAGCPE